MLFNYELRPPKECLYPQENGVNQMAWFWLTDSHYHVELGDVRLFERSLESRKKEGSPRYDSYQYSRFLEDFFDILPEICTPIPEDIYDAIKTMERRDMLGDFSKLFFTGCLQSWFHTL